MTKIMSDFVLYWPIARQLPCHSNIAPKNTNIIIGSKTTMIKMINCWMNFDSENKFSGGIEGAVQEQNNRIDRWSSPVVDRCISHSDQMKRYSLLFCIETRNSIGYFWNSAHKNRMFSCSRLLYKWINLNLIDLMNEWKIREAPWNRSIHPAPQDISVWSTNKFAWKMPAWTNDYQMMVG